MSTPNPAWKPGDKINSPVDEMISISPEEISQPEMYKLIIGSVVPRPIAFVSTCSADGRGNLAPFSFFNGVSSNPPCLVFSVAARSSTGGKDTLRNIQETGQFVVNSANAWLTEPLVYTAADYPFGVDEMQEVGLTPLPSLKVAPARVKESAVHFECVLYKLVEIGDGAPGSAHLVIGRIVHVHIDKSAYKDGKVLLERIQPLARLGGADYGLIGPKFNLPVPKIS